jgi:hypothetical protein
MKKVRTFASPCPRLSPGFSSLCIFYAPPPFFCLYLILLRFKSFVQDMFGIINYIGQLLTVQCYRKTGVRALRPHRYSSIVARCVRDRSRLHFHHSQASTAGDEGRGQESHSG